MSRVRRRWWLSFEDPVETFSSHVTGLLNVLEAMRTAKPDARLYSASSGQVFGDRPTPSAEDCPYNPCSPYGVAKVASMQMIKIYREVHGIFACAGITFNHESLLRPASYVPVRIVQGAFDIAQKRRSQRSARQSSCGARLGLGAGVRGMLLADAAAAGAGGFRHRHRHRLVAGGFRRLGCSNGSA